ncbi:MAG: FeoA family protein [Candidatus Margulisiibacteriota bacterium]
MSSQTVSLSRLSDIHTPAPVRIVDIQADIPLSMRLRSLGFVPGTEVRRLAAIGGRGPITFLLRDTKIAIRHMDAQSILVSA